MNKMAIFSIKNLFRNKRRSMLTMSVVIVSFLVLSIFQGYIASQKIGWRDLMIHNDYGHLQIFHNDYDKDDSANFLTMIDPDTYHKLTEIIKDQKNVQFFSPRLELSGLVGNESNTKIFIGSARAAEENERLYYFELAKEGDSLSDKEPRGVLVGQKLASKLNAKIGDHLLLMANSVYGSIEAIDTKIIGLSKTYSQFDSMGIFLRNQDAKDLLLTDNVHSVVVLLKKGSDERFIVKQLNDIFNNKNLSLKALSFEQIATFFVQVIRMYENYFKVSLIILSILIGFSLANTIYMSITERTKEFSVMKTIGISSQTIVSSILMEGFWLAFIGVIVGGILSYFGHEIINGLGLTLSPPPGSDDRIPFNVIFTLAANIKICAVLIGISLFASLIPAIRIIHLDVIKGLRDD